jgi:hypothetical protein
VAWPVDRLLTIYQGGRIGDAQSIVHRGEITKLVRECQLYADRVTVKYGIAGRVLLGPKGAPGPVTMSIGIKVADADRCWPTTLPRCRRWCRPRTRSAISRW